jgi:hypothetical protein
MRTAVAERGEVTMISPVRIMIADDHAMFRPCSRPIAAKAAGLRILKMEEFPYIWAWGAGKVMRLAGSLQIVDGPRPKNKTRTAHDLPLRQRRRLQQGWPLNVRLPCASREPSLFPHDQAWLLQFRDRALRVKREQFIRQLLFGLDDHRRHRRKIPADRLIENLLEQAGLFCFY